MFVACWSSKGGSGTTVVASGLALLLARSGPTLLADLAGDVPAVLGLPAASGPGIAQWLAAEADVGPQRLAKLEVPVADNLSLLTRGSASAFEVAAAGVPRVDAGRTATLAESLRQEAGQRSAADAADPGRQVVVDCGLLDRPEMIAVASAADVGLLVLRPCFVALSRALQLPIRPTGVILVREPERALTQRDVEDVLGVPVRARLDIDPSVSRAVDAGILARRMPRALERGLRGAA